MISFIALIIWEGLVFYFAQGFFKAAQNNSENNLNSFAGAVVMTLVILGLAVLPFTGAFSPE